MFLKIEKIFKNIHTSDKKTKNGEHSTKCREMKQIKNIPVCEENVRCKSCTFQPKEENFIGPFPAIFTYKEIKKP